MKLFKRFVSWTIWGIILLNLMLMGVSHIPVAQHFVGKKVADAVGRHLGTEVSVGRVDMGFLNRIIIDDLRILDQRRKPMVRVARLTAQTEEMVHSGAGCKDNGAVVANHDFCVAKLTRREALNLNKRPKNQLNTILLSKVVIG